MASKSDKGYSVNLEVKPDRIVSDGRQEVTLKCTFSGNNKKPPKEDIPVTFSAKKLKIKEERSARKGVATYKFKPTRPTGKTRVVCTTPHGEESAWIFVNPTPYQYVRDMLQAVVLAFIVAFGIIRPFILQTYFIPSGSMIPTLYEKDRIVGLMFTYRFRDPQPGEIVIFDKETDFVEHEIPLGFKTIKWKTYTKFIKRVIATGGDVLEVRDLTVYINGKPLDEPYIYEPPYHNFGPYTVPEDSLFMMGDNRNNSNDSRYWGPLPRDRVISKATVRFWPLDRLGVLQQKPLKYK